MICLATEFIFYFIIIDEEEMGNMKRNIRWLWFGLFLCAWVCPSLVCAEEFDVIQPAGSLPPATPWDLKALSAPPAVEWAETVEGVRSLYYKGETYQGKPARVFAYYATPGTLSGDTERDNNLPAMVLVHGGGGKAFKEWAELWAKRGYAAIAMDLAGNGPDGNRLDDGGPNQSDKEKFEALGEPVTEQWTYHAVADVILAHSLIRSFPEVNRQRIAVTGISWGGYLTCIVAGLDNRFKAAVPVYGCGFLYENSVWLDQFARMTPEHREKWINLWDPSMYVGSASMPMLFVNGGQDFAYPPDSYAKTCALVKSTKIVHFTPSLPHGHIFDRPKAIELFVEQCLNGGTPLPVLEPVRVGNDHVWARVESKTKLVSAELHYTTDTLPGDNKNRVWHSRPATARENRIVADTPPEDATAWFLTVTDERDATVSSEIILSEE